jgi:hypothetical protein
VPNTSGLFDKLTLGKVKNIKEKKITQIVGVTIIFLILGNLVKSTCSPTPQIIAKKIKEYGIYCSSVDW